MTRIGSGVAVQRSLLPAYDAAIARLLAAHPEDAQVISGYVGALRMECNGRRIEARELRVLVEVER